MDELYWRQSSVGNNNKANASKLASQLSLSLASSALLFFIKYIDIIINLISFVKYTLRHTLEIKLHYMEGLFDKLI